MAYNQTGGAPRKKNGCLTLLLIAVAVVFLIFIVAFVMGMFDATPTEPYAIGGGTGNYASDEGGIAGEQLEISGLRGNYTTIKGDGKDTVTVMIYICGADLESQNGCATSDILEMIDASKSDNVNIVLQTGGTSQWQNNLMNSNESERYLITEDGVNDLDCGLGQRNMANQETLRDFIKYAAKEFPANRYMLIMWDHGGGTLGGYGYDENYTRYGAMQIDEIGTALKQAGVKFDFVGFDACLMGTIETSYMLEDYADYLIASEETEPADGWYYTDWINALNENTSITTEEIGREIIDSYVDNLGRSSAATLSIVELRRVPYLYDTVCDFLDVAQQEIEDLNFNAIAKARSYCKSYGEDGYDQVDLVNFVTETELDGYEDVIAAVSNAVVYRRSKNVPVSYGISIYFPYSWLEYYSSGLSIQYDIGMDDEYTGFFKSFVSALSGGQNASYRTSGGGRAVDLSGEEWYDADLVAALSEKYEKYDFASLSVIDKGDYYALKLTEQERAVITRADLRLFYSDGEGYIDLGSDSVAEYDKDYDLAMNFDETWVALDGNIISYYVLDEDLSDETDWYSYGYSNATINGVYGYVIIRWDNAHYDGYVVGWQPRYTESYPVSSKGYFDIEDGDVLKFVLEYYDSTGAYVGDYFYDFEIVADGDITVSYKNIGDDYDVNIFYEITDIYDNVHMTEMVSLYD